MLIESIITGIRLFFVISLSPLGRTIRYYSFKYLSTLACNTRAVSSADCFPLKNLPFSSQKKSLITGSLLSYALICMTHFCRRILYASSLTFLLFLLLYNFNCLSTKASNPFLFTPMPYAEGELCISSDSRNLTNSHASSLFLEALFTPRLLFGFA